MSALNKADLQTLDYAASTGPMCRVTAKNSILTSSLDIANNNGPYWSVSGVYATYHTIWGRTITTIVTISGKLVNTIVTFWGR